jgi:hypothetical protein
LCQWASRIADARGYNAIWRKSPAQELIQDCPTLSFSEAEKLLIRLDKSAELLSRPIKAIDIAQFLWPYNNLWDKEPSIRHAFDWLVWCINYSLSCEEVKLLQIIREKWLINSDGAMARAYSVINTDDALKVLQMWLGLKKNEQEWPPVPVQLPQEILLNLTTDWRKQLVLSEGQFFIEMLGLNPDRVILESAARVTLEYYQSNPLFLNISCAEALYPYLSSQEVDKLYSLLPPEDPGDPPDNYPDVIKWFNNSYMPYRMNSSQDLVRVREIARKFSIWFLCFYAQSRSGGDGAKYLSWCKSARLGKTSDGITLIVVLDGLGVRDGESFAKYLQEKSTRLELDEFEIVVSPLPTITCMAKPALFTGFNPTLALEENECLGTVERRAPEVIDALNKASAGDIIIWSILEPDHTYHQSKDLDSIRSEVNGWMQGFTARLSDVVNQISDTKKLKIIITTDHGRLLSSAQRLHQVPTGMEAHGRVAWGDADIQFDESGYCIDGAVVYLHPERFGIPKTCALLINDDAFVMSDGRGGKESFPHGGIFPEEVLIPWIQFSRDRGTITIEASLTGQGVAKLDGIYLLEILNTSPVRISILGIEIQITGFKAQLHIEVAAMTKIAKEIPVTYWPSNTESHSLEAIITYALPTGERNKLIIKPSLEISEMYQQEDILSDL